MNSPNDNPLEVSATALKPRDSSPESLLAIRSGFVRPNLRKGQWFSLSTWLHLRSDANEISGLAAGLGFNQKVGSAYGIPAAEGTVITARLEPRTLLTSDNLFCRRKPIVKNYHWNGAPTNVDFIVKCQASHREDHVIETVKLYSDGMQIGEVVYTIGFEQGSWVSAETKFVRTAFASYSREDAQDMVARLQGIEKAIPSISIWWDVERFRSGDDWEKRLAAEVPTKDIFYLFWSKNAAKSKWVDMEWRFALQSRGLAYIDPIPLDRTPPPKELESLQFTDRFVRHLEYEKLLRQE